MLFPVFGDTCKTCLYILICIYFIVLFPDRGYKEYLDKENHHEKQSYDR
jgi:hypothetical protein